MTKNKTKVYQTPVHRFPIIVRDQDHFTTIISTLDKNCSKGITNWTMTKKVGKYLRRGKIVTSPSVIKTEVLIFNKNVNTTELETFIKLL